MLNIDEGFFFVRLVILFGDRARAGAHFGCGRARWADTERVERYGWVVGNRTNAR